MFYGEPLFEGLLAFSPGYFFYCSKTFLRIIFSVIFISIQLSTCWRNELHWICFLSFHILIQIWHLSLEFLNPALNNPGQLFFLRWTSRAQLNECIWTLVHLAYTSQFHTFQVNHQSLQWNVRAHVNSQFSVIWSSLLISVTWGALLGAGL